MTYINMSFLQLKACSKKDARGQKRQTRGLRRKQEELMVSMWVESLHESGELMCKAERK